MRSKLQHVAQFNSDDFGLTTEEFVQLRTAEENNEDVNIDCLSTEGPNGYFDITLADGTEIVAIDGYHLTTISELKEVFSR